MKSVFRKIIFGFIFLALLSLVACGGSGGGSDDGTINISDGTSDNTSDNTSGDTSSDSDSVTTSDDILKKMADFNVLHWPYNGFNLQKKTTVEKDLITGDVYNNSWDFFYDDQGYLRQIDFFYDSSLMRSTIYSYNENKRVNQYTYYDGNGNIEEYGEINYNQNGFPTNKIEYYNYINENHKSEYHQTISYGNNTIKIIDERYDLNDSTNDMELFRKSEIIYSYNDSLKIVSLVDEEILDLKADLDKRVATYSYENDNLTKIVREKTNLKTGETFLDSENHIAYDEYGNIKTIEYYEKITSENQHERYEKATYNYLNGILVEIIDEDDDDNDGVFDSVETDNFTYNSQSLPGFNYLFEDALFPGTFYAGFLGDIETMME